MKFSRDYLLQQLGRHATPPCYQVAFSGGLDSQVLLHALCALRDQLAAGIGAVHVHHGLHADADRWEAHCRRVCDELNVAYTSLRVDGRPAQGESPEAAARVARYQALAEWLPAQHCLLTAQHQDDQAETLLLQLIRGSGVSGLAAMPVMTALGAGQLLRPLLEMNRAALQHYADRHGLSWVEDPGNRNIAYDRNYLRHRVLPMLRQRWPSISSSLSRSAAHCAEANELTAQLARNDLLAVTGRQAETLSVTRLVALPQERQRNVLRAWLKQRSASLPSTAVLARIVNDVLHSRADASPCVRWDRYEVRRYRDEVFCLQQTPRRNTTRVLDWSLSGPLILPDKGGVLTAVAVSGAGIRRSDAMAGTLSVRWRKGGECCRPAGRGHLHSLKKMFQEQGIPPWERNRIPLIYIEDRLAMVPGFQVCEPFQAGPADPGVLIEWDRHPGQPQGRDFRLPAPDW
ncbi:MAG: tRNA lysidine(34) synthetase TilS [Gammaproteobacteria bacterium]|jgi:tRNA(Ile)-lysidine synthase|nr:tRNA lysidine(34) synthetase TilS [Gammaproteobacteria bacterium]